MLLSSLLVALLQDRVDLHEPAAVGSVMAERLGKAFGVKVYAGEGIADVPLIFDVKAVTFEEFRTLSAQGLDATWRAVRDGWELYRTPAQIKAELDAFLAKRAARIKKEISNRTKDPSMAQADLDEFALKVKLANDDDMFEIISEYDVLPDESLMFDVWTDFGATHFATLPIDRRWVYTSDGRAGTKKLAVLEDLMRRVRHERERVIDALKKSGAWQRLASSAGTFDPDRVLRYLGFGDVKTLVLEVISTQSTVGLAVYGFDDKDASCLEYYDSVSCDERERSRITDTVQDVEVVLSPASTEIHEYFKRLLQRGEGDAAATSDGLEPYVKVLMKMDEIDLLGYDVTDILFTAAAQTGKPLVGRLSDDIAYSSPFFRPDNEEDVRSGKVRLRSGLSWIDDHLQIESDGAIKTVPELPVSFQSNFPRRAIIDYVKANRGKPIIDLGRIGSVLRAPESLDAEELGEMALIVHPTFETMFETDFTLLSAWVELGQQQRQQASSVAGVNVPFSRCSKMLQHSFMYSAVNYGQWSMVYGSPEGEDQHEFVDSDTAEGIDDWLLFDVHPDTFKNLLVNFRTKKGFVALVHSEEYGDQPVTATPAELAAWIHELESDPDYKEELQDLLGGKFGIEEQLEIELRYQTPVGAMLATTAVQTSAGGRSDYALEQLPAVFLNEYRRELAALRKGG